MNRVFYHILFLFSAIPFIASAADADSIPWREYAPHIHGTLRSRWEANLSDDVSRFKIRNARLSLDGHIHPAVEYYMQVDLCQNGDFKFLDGWARLAFGSHWKTQMGQYRMPLGNETFRAPHTYIFANRSYMGRYMCNIRAAGVKAIYELKTTGLTLEGGIFNPTSISDQTGWHKTYSAAMRGILQRNGWRLDAGYMTIKPLETRVNIYDAGVAWKGDRWEWAAEYLVRLYTNDAHVPTHSWVAWANYSMPVKAGIFNRLSFQGRYDGMSDFSSTVGYENGHCPTTASARQRFTGGVTLSYMGRGMWLDLRANYEHRWFNTSAPVGDTGDRAVVEMVIRF